MRTRWHWLLSACTGALALACGDAYVVEDSHSEQPAAQSGERDLTISARAAVRKSSGFYSIPYEAGTKVRVSRDHLTHTPVNRIDMSGTSGGPYRVVAAASGHIRFIEDSHDTTGSCADNNYVWIEHANGEWTKYSHMKKDSTSVSAGLKVGDWVRAGQFIGVESDIGCASGDHVHFEVAVPDDPADPIVPSGGYIKGENLVPKVCGIDGQLYVASTTYTVPDVRPGSSEYARHGLAHDKFQAVFDAATNCGYSLDWNDGFEANGKAYFNVVFRPSVPGVAVKSHRMLTKADLDAKMSEYVTQGEYELAHVDVYNVGAAVRYAAIFKKAPGFDTAAYYGVDASTHQAFFDAYTGAGWLPRVLSVTSVSGVRTYAAIYRQGSLGSWSAKSFQTSAQYQTNAEEQDNAGRRLIYLNSYVHNGAPRYTAIWSSATPSGFESSHGMTPAQYQSNWSAHAASGWKTGAVTGIHLNGATSYAAYWFK